MEKSRIPIDARILMAGFWQRLWRSLTGQPKVATPRKPATAPVHSALLSGPKKVADSLPKAETVGAPTKKRSGPAFHHDLLTVFPGSEAVEKHTLSEKIARRIEVGNFELPHLPSTQLAVLQMLGDASSDIAKIVKTIAEDPALAGEVLKIANSAMYGGAVEIKNLQDAVVRVGARALRGTLMGVAMKDVVFRAQELESTAKEVWRQATSTAVIARALAPRVGIDAEHGYMLGLLHDIGKVALLDLLRKETKLGERVNDSVVATVFAHHHESAGAALAKKWNLAAEIAAVAGNHERVGPEHPHAKSAALAVLSQRIDLFLFLGNHAAFDALAHGKEMKLLGADEIDAKKLLDLGAVTFREVEAAEPVGAH
jgi:putative nucleotidyltransferase with HDIG domain